MRSWEGTALLWHKAGGCYHPRMRYALVILILLLAATVPAQAETWECVARTKHVCSQTGCKSIPPTITIRLDTTSDRRRFRIGLRDLIDDGLVVGRELRERR